MRPQGTGSDEFTASQREGLGTRNADQERTLAAKHRLEKALESAAPRREGSWRDEVMTTLTVLGEATIQEAENADRPRAFFPTLLATSRAYATACAGSERSTGSSVSGSWNSIANCINRRAPCQISPICASDSPGC
jgi:hypothetical protein